MYVATLPFFQLSIGLIPNQKYPQPLSAIPISNTCASGRSFMAPKNALFHAIKHKGRFSVVSKAHLKGEDTVIAIGSNVGDRIGHFHTALNMMKKVGINIVSHSGLYESAPAYYTTQPNFLNAAVRAHTEHDPHTLLKLLKEIEKSLGRADGGIRYGPRPLDLDILFYGQNTVSSECLTIPHPRICERPFVLAPLMDLCGTNLVHNSSMWSSRFERAACAWNFLGGDKQLGGEVLKRVIPVRKRLWYPFDKTQVMGILNVTPDSFSDGGKYFSVQDAVNQAQALVAAGAAVIDIGAQSTRPSATRITTEEEMARLLPVLEAVKELECMNSVYLSVDTFDSKVAREAVSSGADIINDVSGGLLDPEMYETIAELGVPYVLMHMRGDPVTMRNEENTNYGNVIEEVADELCAGIEKAESSGIPGWSLLLDPGLGFSKNAEQDLCILRGLPSLRSRLAAWSLTVSQGPLVIGPSRKSFLGALCGQKKAENRDTATVGAVVSGISNGADIVRIHNVKASFDAMRVADAIFRPNGSHHRGFGKLSKKEIENGVVESQICA